jgi:tRNA U55 pseudouridine synthase TruB
VLEQALADWPEEAAVHGAGRHDGAAVAAAAGYSAKHVAGKRSYRLARRGVR